MLPLLLIVSGLVLCILPDLPWCFASAPAQAVLHPSSWEGAQGLCCCLLVIVLGDLLTWTGSY